MFLVPCAYGENWDLLEWGSTVLHYFMFDFVSGCYDTIEEVNLFIQLFFNTGNAHVPLLWIVGSDARLLTASATGVEYRSCYVNLRP
jgi:hypothetical protein